MMKFSITITFVNHHKRGIYLVNIPVIPGYLFVIHQKHLHPHWILLYHQLNISTQRRLLLILIEGGSRIKRLIKLPRSLMPWLRLVMTVITHGGSNRLIEGLDAFTGNFVRKGRCRDILEIPKPSCVLLTSIKQVPHPAMLIDTLNLIKLN